MENEGLIIGRNPVFEHLRALSPKSGAVLYVAENAHGKIITDITALAKSKGVTIIGATREEIYRLHDSSSHQGVILKLNQKLEKSIREYSGDEIIDMTVEKKGVTILLDQLTDPHNVGSIIRTAEALGATGVIIPRDNSAGLSSTVIKCAAGATAYMPIATVTNIASFLKDAKKKGCWVAGTSDQGTDSPAKLSSLRPLIIVIGNEGEGMRRLTTENCDLIVRIDLRGEINSLNASVAAGILIYEALKQ